MLAAMEMYAFFLFTTVFLDSMPIIFEIFNWLPITTYDLQMCYVFKWQKNA